MRATSCTPMMLSLVLLSAVALRAADDIVIADFEGATYGRWQVEGEAFGAGPARGTLPGQMPVSGYEGQGLVNSFHQGDRTTGKLTSPPFALERRYLNFLLGGGKHPGQTCINLLVDGQVVRTASGPNDRPGGSERLQWQSWDLAPLVGRQARIEIVDQHTGGWGHINVDQLVLSDRPIVAEPARRTLRVERQFLWIPIRNGAPQRRVKLVVDGHAVRQFDAELASGEPDFYTFADVAAWKGAQLTIEAGRFVGGPETVAAIRQSDEQPGQTQLYAEPSRPQFHFTSRRGWLNDPNGLVYYRGEWHLFYQHNPFGWNWGNMHWGHAVSDDLVHWRELGDALHPWSDAQGAVFSGSAVVDHRNTSGFQTGDDAVIVAAFTDTGAGESIAYSSDRGRRWSLYEGNPVVKHTGRDPKLVWHPPSGRWIMAVYTEAEGKRWIALHSSPDLKQWQFESRLEGFFECPDLFELAIDGDPQNSRWVIYAADGQYVLGQFDGRRFQPEHQGKHTVWYGNFYAAQTYSNAPDGRRVQIGWARGVTFPGMPFNQQMTVPVDLTLRTTSDGVRMFAEPVPEIATLREQSFEMRDVRLQDATRSFDVDGELYDVTAEFDPGDSRQFGLQVRGQEVVYDTREGKLSCGPVTAPLAPVEGKVVLRVLADRGSLEVFGNSGRVALSRGVLLRPEDRRVAAFSRGGTATLKQLTVHQLKSAWR